MSSTKSSLNDLYLKMTRKIYSSNLKSEKDYNQFFKDIVECTNLNIQDIKKLKDEVKLNFAKSNKRVISNTILGKERELSRREKSVVEEKKQLQNFFTDNEYSFLTTHMDKDFFLNRDTFKKECYDNKIIKKTVLEEMLENTGSEFGICYILARQLLKEKKINKEDFTTLLSSIYFFKSSATLLIYKFFLFLDNKSNITDFVLKVKSYLHNNIEFNSLQKAQAMFENESINVSFENKRIKNNALIDFYNELIDNIENLPLEIKEKIITGKFIFEDNPSFNFSNQFLKGKIVTDLFRFYENLSNLSRTLLSIEPVEIFLLEYEFNNCNYIKNNNKDKFNLEDFEEAKKILTNQLSIYKNRENITNISKLLKTTSSLNDRFQYLISLKDYSKIDFNEYNDFIPEDLILKMNEISKGGVPNQLITLSIRMSLVSIEGALFYKSTVEKYTKNIEKFRKQTILITGLLSGFKKDDNKINYPTPQLK